MMLLVPIMSRFAKGWPEHPIDLTIAYAASGAAMTTRHETDAHFAAYSVPSVLRRLSGQGVFAALAPLSVRMTLFVLDVEPEGHAPRTAAWDEAEAAKITKLLAAHPGGYVYTTRGGYRVVYALATPFELRSLTDAERWKATYTAWLDYVASTFCILADRLCKDWTRLYRLPFVVRDGVVQDPETLNNPAALGAWDVTVEIGTIAEISVTPSADNDYPPASPGLMASARDRLKSRGAAVEGQGANQHTYSCAAMLLHSFALSEVESWTLLGEWNTGNPKPWSPPDLADIMNHAKTYAAGERGADRREYDGAEALRVMLKIPTDAERPDPTAYPENALLFAGAPPEVVPSDEPVALPGTWDYEIARARAEVTNAFGVAAGPISNAPFFVPASSLNRDFGPTPWLVRGLISEGGVIGIIGEPKSTKSWMALELSCAIASGTPAFGEFVVARPRKVAYFFAEDHAQSVRNRIRSFAAARGLTYEALAKNLFVQPAGEHINLTRDEDVARIVASCRLIGDDLGMLVLDPLRDVHSAKENESDGMSDVMARLRLLKTLLKTTVTVPHHAKKPDKGGGEARAGNDIRGSSAIYGALDGLLALRDLVEEQTADGTIFGNSVKCEVKGAKSAGTFHLTLKITDGPDGTAVHAGWKHQSAGAAKVAEAVAKPADLNAREDRAFELVETIELLKARKLRTSTKNIRKEMVGGTKSVADAIEFAMGKSWISKTDSGYDSTPEGRAKIADPPVFPLDTL